VTGFSGKFALANNLIHDASELGRGPASVTLLKTDTLRLVLVNLAAGQALKEHSAPGGITIHCVTGAIAVQAGDDHVQLGPGELVAMEPGVRHSVEASEQSAFLLTIAWPGERRAPVDRND
jgi:quercetin dioxygenase-like cupin family protein